MEINLKVLASPALNPFFFEAEGAFQELSTHEKVKKILSYQPEIFQVETTTRCNLNCPLCSTHGLRRGYREIDLGLIRKITSGSASLRYMCLHLMGEPLLSRSIFSIVRYLKAKGIYTYFSTNGILLDEKVPDILSSGLDKISISLDGITQEDLGRYRANADLDKILRGINRLKKQRSALNLNHPLIQTQTIMFSYNEKKRAEIVDFLKSLGVDRIKLKKPSFDTFGGGNDGTRTFTKQENDAEGPFSRNLKSYMKYRDRSVCRMLFQGFVLSDGSVVPCCIDYDGQYAFGNLNSMSWKEIRRSAQREKILSEHFSKKLELCYQCSLGYEYSTTAFDRTAMNHAAVPDKSTP